MAFIKSIEQVNNYVTVENSIELETLQPYFTRVERDMQEIIGKELLMQIETPGEDALLLEAKEYACGIIASSGLSQALNALKLKIGNAGVKLSTPQNTDQPNWWDIKDLQRDLNRTSNKYLNYLLKCFEANTDVFTAWETSPVQLQQKDLLITSLAEFEQYYSLNGSFTTFIALRPFIRDAQLVHLQKQLMGCFANSDLTDEMKSNLNAALANYTIASVADTGLFKLEENGALVKIEMMPWEKTEKISDIRLERLKDQRKEIAEDYLRKALVEIAKLPCFTPSHSSELIAIKKPSMLFVGRGRV